MVTAEARIEGWRAELSSSGRVEVDLRRWVSLSYLVVVVLLFLFCAGLMAAATDTFGRVFGALFLLFLGWMAVFLAVQLLGIGSWASPVVLVDGVGVTVRNGVLQVPWGQLMGADVGLVGRSTKVVALVVSDECYDAWIGAHASVWRRMVRWSPVRGVINLPPNLAVDVSAFAAWLTAESARRSAGQA